MDLSTVSKVRRDVQGPSCGYRSGKEKNAQKRKKNRQKKNQERERVVDLVKAEGDTLHRNISRSKGGEGFWTEKGSRDWEDRY